MKKTDIEQAEFFLDKGYSFATGVGHELDFRRRPDWIADMKKKLFYPGGINDKNI